MSAAATTIENVTALAPTAQLAQVVTDLEPDSAQTLRAAFETMFSQAEEWAERAKAIRVTSEDQKREIKMARESRLALRDIRVRAEHTRKRLKEDSLRTSKAIDGIANVLKALIIPIEDYLQEQETFAIRAEAKRKDAIRESRKAALSAYGTDASVYSDLGEASEETWGSILETARAAHESRLEAERQAEAVRVEAERIAAEKREVERQEAIKREAERVAREKTQAEENARLRREAEEREAAAKVERERIEAERAAERAKARAEADAREAAARVEREAAEAEARKAREEAARAAAELAAEKARAEAERVQREAEDAARKAAEADAAKPTKAKYGALVAALRTIAANSDEPTAAEVARGALEAVGLGGEP